ncbi:MAG: CBS domain-containing protein [Flavobacteriales bacterium]|jgi:CBS domain-containing protein|nr:CBS domain-containing protein [Flavobacteriales bacterium]MBT6013877.1 CBS domain-containing protein [Flavobacteriales bacterium]MBT7481214.1 CBS domain-containing protein [Flavobacteriales bacterium]
MQAYKLISSSIESILPSEDGNRALQMMDQYRINHLAVVKNDFYLGAISDKEIMNWNSTEEYIEEHLPNLASPHVLHNQHLFDIIEVLEQNNLSVIPVLDEDNQYKGVITNRKLLYTIAKSATIQSVGGVIVLQMNNNDYSLTEIASIVESNDTKILSSYVISRKDSTQMELTIKLNKTDITDIIKDFERHEYVVSASYKEQDSDTDFLERYESLMKFLNP